MSNINTDEWNNNFLVMQDSTLSRSHRSIVVGLSRLYELIPEKNVAILDVGCGSGTFIREFYNKGYRRIYGIEPDTALTANIPAGIAEIRNDKAGQMSFPDATFDAVFVYGVMHHLKGPEDYAAACREMDRVLKPGGVIFIMEPGRLWMIRMVELATRVLGPFSAALRALREALEEEREDVYSFIKNHPMIRGNFLDRNYLPVVDRYFLYSWVFTAKKPH